MPRSSTQPPMKKDPPQITTLSEPRAAGDFMSSAAITDSPTVKPPHPHHNPPTIPSTRRTIYRPNYPVVVPSPPHILPLCAPSHQPSTLFWTQHQRCFTPSYQRQIRKVRQTFSPNHCINTAEQSVHVCLQWQVVIKIKAERILSDLEGNDAGGGTPKTKQATSCNQITEMQILQ